MEHTGGPVQVGWGYNVWETMQHAGEYVNQLRNAAETEDEHDALLIAESCFYMEEQGTPVGDQTLDSSEFEG